MSKPLTWLIMVVAIVLSGCSGTPATQISPAAGGNGAALETPVTADQTPATFDTEMARMKSHMGAMQTRMDGMKSQMGAGGTPSPADMQSMMDDMRDVTEQMRAMMGRLGTPDGTMSDYMPQMQVMMAMMETMGSRMKGMADGAGMGGMMSSGESMDLMMQQMRAMHGRLDSRMPSSDPHHPTPTAGETGMANGHDDATYAFGEPADPATASRVLEIHLLDTLKFDPPAVDVKLGETVTFRAINSGVLSHDFTLGDEASQQKHEAEMAKMAAMGVARTDEPNAFTVPAGQTKELTWKFTQAGEVIYGCHTPGHYAAGMVGRITVK